MFFILSNVPAEAGSEDIRLLVQQFSSVEALKTLNDEQSNMSEYLPVTFNLVEVTVPS